MRSIILLIFLCFLQKVHLYAQVNNDVTIYIGIIKLPYENPIPDYPRFRKIIFANMGNQSTLEMVDFFKNSQDEIIETSQQIIKVEKIDGNHYIFKPSNDDFQLLIKVKHKRSILKIKHNNWRLIKKRKNRIKLYLVEK